MSVYLQLFHGRDTIDEELDDWGFEGPLLGPLEYVQLTYMSTVHFSASPEVYRKIFPQQAAEWDAKGYANMQHPSVSGYLNITNNLVEYEGKFYGDFSITSESE